MGPKDSASELSAQLKADFTRIIEQGQDFPVVTLGNVSTLFDRAQRVIAMMQTDIKEQRRATAKVKRDIDDLYERLDALEGGGEL